MDRLCAGQTLLCKSLGLKVVNWDGKQLQSSKFRIVENYGDGETTTVREIIQTTRLGIPKGRDEHLDYRLIDAEYVTKCTKNPLTVRRNLPKATRITK